MAYFDDLITSINEATGAIRLKWKKVGDRYVAGHGEYEFVISKVAGREFSPGQRTALQRSTSRYRKVTGWRLNMNGKLVHSASQMKTCKVYADALVNGKNPKWEVAGME